jgi:hypothetical protein
LGIVPVVVLLGDDGDAAGIEDEDDNTGRRRLSLGLMEETTQLAAKSCMYSAMPTFPSQAS